MNAKTIFPLIVLGCLAATGLSPAAVKSTPSATPSANAPAVPPKEEAPRIEVCFVLDTTGSMGGLIEGAKQKIWAIANEMVRPKPTPQIRFGLVGYRDLKDEYVTKTFNLTDDLDSIYGHLRAFQANGGGDTPEAVNEALAEAVRKMDWSADRKVLKIVFLVGDAPPHMDYPNGPKYADVCQEAMKKDLIINTIQCGNMSETTPIWQEIARRSEGTYVAIGQTGNMVVMATPMDKDLAELNRQVGKTLIAYGVESERKAVMLKQTASESAPAPAAADRLYFNAASRKAVQGTGELLDAISEGKLKLAEVKKDELPEELRNLSPTELNSHVEKQQQARSELQKQIAELGKKRENWLNEERKRLAGSDKRDAFDEKVAETIRAQAAKKDIVYPK
ncbi:MAG TPA: VWA domain-containing protein [Roseimicrobium sp.]|nr:VWA domain-containing protein [Roseimicrobium sp.]